MKTTIATIARIKSLVTKAMLAGLAAGAIAAAVPATAQAQEFRADVRLGHYDARRGAFEFERRQEFLRREAFLRHEEWLRQHRFRDGYGYR
jgi:hypothetical protein